jgi:hypothetical protein
VHEPAGFGPRLLSMGALVDRLGGNVFIGGLVVFWAGSALAVVAPASTR